MPQLSIITINYNDAPGLRKTIESVISQTSNDFEYIVIDGGSTDGSTKVIKEYQDHITYWVSEADKGIYNAMNKGINAAKGEYCQFLNSGDILVGPDVVEMMLNDMPECSILIGNMFKVMPNGKVLCDKGLENKTPGLYTFYRGTLNHSPAYIKRELFEKYGSYDENFHIVADWKWYLIAVGLNNEKVCYRDINVNRFDMGGISNTNRELEKEERRRVLEKYLPVGVLNDYDKFGKDIDRMQRLRRWPLIKRLVFSIERVLFKLEKTSKNR